MKLLAIVITYYPDVDELEQNILSYIDTVEKLIIWDNTPEKVTTDYCANLHKYKNKIEVKYNGRNDYIAFPLNQAVKQAKAEGYTHLLTMDQDSQFSGNCFEKYIQTIEQNTDKSIAIWGANPNGMYKTDQPVLIVPQCITSGSVYPLSIFEKIGLFREDFAIYVVDIEFGIRARKYGYQTAIVSDSILKHTFGKQTRTRTGIITNNYPPLMTYFIIRNTIITWIDHPRHFKIKKGFIQGVIYRIVTVITDENNKSQKMKAIFLGIVDGIRKKVQTRNF